MRILFFTEIPDPGVGSSVRQMYQQARRLRELGHQTAVALGDYVAGPSHVLPTGATARWASGLSSNDFLRPSSVIEYTQVGLERDGLHAQRVARQEGLTAHALSIEVRLEGEGSDE